MRAQRCVRVPSRGAIQLALPFDLPWSVLIRVMLPRQQYHVCPKCRARCVRAHRAYPPRIALFRGLAVFVSFRVDCGKGTRGASRDHYSRVCV